MSEELLPTRPAVFLDTNALQYINSYLRNAQCYELAPFSNAEMTYDDIRTELCKHMPKAIAGLLMNGCKTAAFLQERAGVEDDSGIVVYTSRLSKAEMMFGILDGQAHARLAQEGISYRMRQRLRDLSELVSMRLQRKDFESLSREVDDLLEMLIVHTGVSIDFAEDDGEIAVIARLSELMQSSVFLEVLDCWMYGCALAMQAERLITFDRYFSHVANFINNPQGDEDWQQVHDQICDELKSLFPVPTAVPLSLPAVQGLPNHAPGPWTGALP